MIDMYASLYTVTGHKVVRRHFTQLRAGSKAFFRGICPTF